MRCTRNGFPVFHGAKDLKAYSHGDRYRCPGCGAEVVTGFGKPVSMLPTDRPVVDWLIKPITIRPFREGDHPGPKIEAYNDEMSP
jgi:hypothetical protein